MLDVCHLGDISSCHLTHQQNTGYFLLLLSQLILILCHWDVTEPLSLTHTSITQEAVVQGTKKSFFDLIIDHSE